MALYRHKSPPRTYARAAQWRAGKPGESVGPAVAEFFTDLEFWAQGHVDPDGTLYLHDRLPVLPGDYVVHDAMDGLIVVARERFEVNFDPEPTIGGLVQSTQSWWRRLCKYISLWER